MHILIARNHRLPCHVARTLATTARPKHSVVCGREYAESAWNVLEVSTSFDRLPIVRERGMCRICAAHASVESQTAIAIRAIEKAIPVVAEDLRGGLLLAVELLRSR